MNDNSSLIIKNLYSSINDELIKLFQQIDNNERTISELLGFVNSLEKVNYIEHDPFKIESESSLHIEEITRCNHRIGVLELENNQLFEIVDKKKKYLKQLDVILAEEKIENKSYEVNNNTHILELQEIERQRIARDLHDITLQNLTHIIHKLEIASIHLDKDIVQAKLEIASSKKEIKNVITEIRNIIFNLRPMTFDDLGLKELFTNYFMSLKHEVDFDISTDIDDIIIEDEVLCISIYRIVHEACSNAIDHSECDLLIVSVKEVDDSYKLVISDDGKGIPDKIDESRKHFGIKIMEERATVLNGKFNIKSGEEGTVITIEIPKNLRGN